MLTVEKKTLVLSFTTENGDKLNLTINAPAEGMNGTRIGAAMDAMIAANAMGEESFIAGKVSAKYMIQQVDEVELA